MEDQLISFETAKLPKDKGFPQISSPCFDSNGTIRNSTYFKSLSNFTGRTKTGYYQSTQSLLQKWLREKTRYFQSSYYI